MENIKVINREIVGFGDDCNCNPNYGNNLIFICTEGEILEVIYHAQNEYDNPVEFSSELRETSFQEHEILKTSEICVVGEYNHKKIFFNNDEVEVSFILNMEKQIIFLAYSYDEISANVIYPQDEDNVIMSEERELIAYLEHLYL